jgi:hypothetical protein
LPWIQQIDTSGFRTEPDMFSISQYAINKVTVQQIGAAIWKVTGYTFKIIRHRVIDINTT